MQLAGALDSPPPPKGRNACAWVMEERWADLFLTYCTNAVLARSEVPELQIVEVPPELAVGASYGLFVLNGAPPDALRLALYVLSPEGRLELRRHGFETGFPSEEE